jgi:hypothetical protein
MRKNLLVAGIAAAALLPSLAFAQQTCEQQSNNRVAGTVVGAGLGAIVGSAVAGHGDRGTGAVIGGIGGAVIGNQVAKGSADCTHAYGYYDSNGAWHATSVARNQAQGYYDRDGRWVAGAPNGYYDGQGRWVSAATSASAAGYYDANGHWVPASANGYYAANGDWVAGSASGYYSNGRWVSGPATGHYDASGRWISGQPSGHRDANGMWIADAQPGYYDANGRWRAGQAYGYYDTQGRWVATAASAGYSGVNASYDTRSSLTGPRDFADRVARMDMRIQRGISDGSLSRGEARRASNDLTAIRREASLMPVRRGQFRAQDAQYLDAKLDTLAASLRWARNN